MKTSGPSGLAKPRGPGAPCRRRSSALQDRDEDVRHRSHSRSQHMRYAIIWFSLAGLLLIAFAVSLRGRMPAPFLMSAFVEGFGCRPIAAMRLGPWPGSESLQ